MKSKSIFLVIMIFLSAFCFSEAKPSRTGVHNYLGKDGKWHYVTTYKDTKTGAEWSSEYVNGDGPNIYHPKQLPSYGLVGGGNTGGGSNEINITQPCEIACEFKATEAGVLELKVDANVEIEIIKLEDASVLLDKTLIYGRSDFQQIIVPSGFYTSKPYGLIAYKNGVATYMELFFFDGSLHNSMEEFSSPGYEAEIPPTN